MATESKTIKVARETVFRAEREASAADGHSGEAAAEEELWSSTSPDGIN